MNDVHERTEVMKGETKIADIIKKFNEKTKNPKIINDKKLDKKANDDETKVDETVQKNETKEDENSLDMKMEIEEKLDTSLEKSQLIISSIDTKDFEKNNFDSEFFNLLRKPQMNEFTLAEGTSNVDPDFTWKISEIKKKLKQKKVEIKSQAFEWSEYPVRAMATLKLVDDEFVSVSLRLEENNRGKAIDLKLIPHVYYLFRDRTGNDRPKHLCFARRYLFTTKFKSSLDFWSTKYFASLLTHSTYNADDSVVMDIYVEPPWMTQAVRSCDGTLEWAVDNCRERKLMEKGLSVWFHESPYFYTGPRGNRVQVKMRSVLGLKVFVDFLPGEFDDDLPLTFPHRTTVTLLNRRDPQRDIVKIVHQKISKDKDYSLEMCSEEEIESVMENDVIFYKVTIEPTN